MRNEEVVESQHESDEDEQDDGEGKVDDDEEEEEVEEGSSFDSDSEDDEDDEDDDEYGIEALGTESEDEGEDEDAEIEEDEGDVILVSETKAQRKPARAKSSSTEGERKSSNRVKVADLPAKVKLLVSAAQNCLRLQIALKSAWTKETSIPTKRLLNSEKLIGASIREACKRSGKSGKPNADLKTAIKLLRAKKGLNAEEKAKRAAMRAKVYTVVWTCASQTRNEIKKKAKQVVEQVFKLGSLSVAQRREVAVWLLETHPSAVNDDNKARSIPNFVFGGVDIQFDRDKNLDRKRTKVERTEPFRNESIPALIYQYYGLAGRANASVNAALDEFSKVPLNLIAFSCNAIEAALMEVTSHHQSTVFSNKNFAAKWDGLMAILETLEDRAGDYLQETREQIWEEISTRLNAGPNAIEGPVDGDEQEDSFIPFLQLRASKPQSRSNEPSSSKAVTQPVSSTPKKARTVSKTTGKSSSSSKKPGSTGPSTSKLKGKRRRGADGSDGEPSGTGHTDDEGSRVAEEVDDEARGDGADIDQLHESGEGEPA
ncbi:uncharacterized protein B0H18DRAFT_1120415 [Fomitopsis serialis]|uniref:uncharacterized protein n=1 Tax=Fomitopsis serialis TaxID=139415 RepID=UPI0020085DDE|nr:uncharacterized protein B0H18DRAFT_1120415 [Neoantrodia serialis]KAH9923571.1 hypothetical protein B0H18DRAFT_1120415 [Neoantrodia serialis]